MNEWHEKVNLRYRSTDEILDIELSEEDRIRKVEWCRRYIGRDWSKVIFSGESGIDTKVRI